MRVKAGLAALAILASCAAGELEAPAGAPEESAGAVAPVSYADVLASVAAERTALGARWRAAKGAKARAAVLRDARKTALDAIVQDLFPPWYGTRWDFYGTSQVPGEGTIACGYFVSTVLRDAGFKVERIRLAQQASEDIVKTLAPPAAIRRFRRKTPEQVLAELKAGEDGLFAVGFDYHVGFVVKDGESVVFCHSSWIKSGGVACEDPATTDAWYSNYYVVGRLLDDGMLTAWLEGTEIPTRRPGK